MDATMRQRNTSGPAIQKWLAIQVEKLHKAAYAEVAEKLQCAAEKEALHGAIRNLYETEKRANEICSALDFNQSKIEKAKKKLANGMKKMRKRGFEASERQLQQEKVSTDLELRLEACKQELDAAREEYEKCDLLLVSYKKESSEKKLQAHALCNQLKALYKECNELEINAIEAAKRLEEHETRVVELGEQLASLKNEYDEANALHFTTEEVCVSETCKKVLWNTTTYHEEVKSIMMDIMTNTTSYPEDFQDTVGIATVQELKKIAEVLAYNKQLELQYQGRKLIWHFEKKDNVSDLLEFAGLHIVTEG